MAKDRSDRTAELGNGRLAEWGVGADAGAGELENFFGRDAAVDAAIVERLGAIASADSVAVLRRLQAGANKETRKAIKRALYRLEQRGVEVPREAKPRRPALSAPAVEGYVSAFDGRGDRLIWLVKPGSGGVLHLFAVLNDPGGLREVAINRLSRKSLREIERELATKHEIRFVDVDWQRADDMLRRGLQWAQSNDAPVQGDYAGLRSRLTAEPPADEVGGPLDGLDLAVLDGTDEETAAILMEPEMRTWVISPESAQSVVEELAEVERSPLVLNEMQKRERVGAVLDRITEETFADRASWARRLDEMAYYFARSRRRPRAEQAAAVARALLDGGAAAQIPFCFAYARRTLGAMMQANEEREQEERKSSLIVTPDQARRKP